MAYPVNVSDLSLLEWSKPSTNPVIPSPPSQVSSGSFRDPTTAWLVGDSYFIAVGSSYNGVGAALVYESSDNMASWDYVGILNSDAFGGSSQVSVRFFT